MDIKIQNYMNIKDIIFKLLYFIIIFFIIYYFFNTLNNNINVMNKEVEKKINESINIQKIYEGKIDSLNLKNGLLKLDISNMSNNIERTKRDIKNLKPPTDINYNDIEVVDFLTNFSKRYEVEND